MTNVELLDFNSNTLHYYRTKIKGNEWNSEDEARRKISRNRDLSFIYKKDNPEKTSPRVWYAYGALRFMVQNNEVKWMENNCVMFPMWYKNKDEYIRLSKEYGVEEEQIRGYTPSIKEVEPDKLSKELMKKESWFQIILKRWKFA